MIPRHRRLAALAAGLALISALLPSLAAAGSQPATPRTGLSHRAAQAIAGAAPSDLIQALVTLTVSADLSQVGGADPAARRVGVIQALQATAKAQQRSLIGDLNRLKAAGAVDRFQSLWVVDAVAVTATPAVLESLAARPEVASVDLDQVDIVPAAVPPTSPVQSNIGAVGAPSLWSQGYFGQGVVVATLDSGVDPANPDLAATYRGGSNSWFDPYGQHSSPADLSGHGTGVMGVIVGGESSGAQIGVAPSARWIAAKIFNDSGASTTSAVHSAFQWVLDPDGNLATADNPRIVNNSWSIGAPGCDLTFSADVNALVSAGILPVFAAGNYGPSGSTSVSPANYAGSVAVGSIDGSGAIASDSSRGPSACGESSSLYPELVAPGVGVTTSDRYGFFQTVSGTSIAAPHVSGVAALLLSARPATAVDQLRASLTSAAADLGPSGPDNTFGYGRVDAFASLAWLDAHPSTTTTTTTVPGPGDLIFGDGFESGSTAAWDATSGGPSVNTSAALTGSFGLQASFSGTKSVFVTDVLASAEPAYHARFRFDPNGSTVASRKTEDLFRGVTSSGTVAVVVQLQSVSGGYEVRAGARDNRGKTAYTAWVSLTDAPHSLEIGWTAASTANGKNGSLDLWVDGVGSGSIGSIANGSMSIGSGQMGPQAVAKGTSGSQLFDDFVSTRTSYIGS